jgi:FkbM family methyltransferase
MKLVVEMYFYSSGNINNLIQSRFLLEKLYQLNSKIKKANNGFIVEDFKGVSSFIRKGTSDSYVFKQVFLDLEYLPLLQLLNNNNIQVNNILDCGANVGYTTTYLKKVYPNSSIYCIEPDKDNLTCIEKNVSLNNLKNVTIINKGIWGKEAFLKITKDFRDGQSWSLSLIEVDHEEDADVKATTITQLIDEYKLTEIDILKIDIEGAERFLFDNEKDAKAFLNITKCIAIEIHDEYDSREMIIKILIENGFKIKHSGELTLGYK